MIGIYVPRLGHVPIKVQRVLTSHNADGTATAHVFIGADIPTPPSGGGEPMPIEAVA